jgi:hypothetical protein
MNPASGPSVQAGEIASRTNASHATTAPVPVAASLRFDTRLWIRSPRAITALQDAMRRGYSDRASGQECITAKCINAETQ